MTMNTRLDKLTCRALFVALALAAGSTVAHADDFEVSIGSTGRWTTSSTIDALTDDGSHAAFSLGAALRLNRISIPLFDLYLDVGMETGSLSGTTFQQIQTEAGLLNGMVGVRAQRRLSKYFYGFGRAAIGMARVSLSLTDDYSYTDPIEDKGVAGSTYFGGGLDLIAIRKPRSRTSKKMITIGLRAEAGYSAFTSVHLRAVPESDSDADGTIHIPTHSAGIGDLNLSAWDFRVALFGRF